MTAFRSTRSLENGEPRITIADYSLRDKLAYLRRIGDEAGAREIESRIARVAEESGSLESAAKSLSIFGWGKARAYEYSEHAFGFIEAGAPSDQPVPIVDARAIQPDSELAGTSLRVTLDRLRIHDYPGSGEHSVLVEFAGRHQSGGDSGEKEQLKFAQTYRVLEGQGAGVAGFPVFVGLQAPADGIQLQIRTINVRNKRDEALISAFESEEVQSGLELIPVANPVVGMLSGVATGVIGAILKRNRNVPVQDVFLGLDFSNIVTRPKLREGTYVAVQIPDTNVANWDWSQWHYESGRVVSRDGDQNALIPLNYFSFSISRR